MPASCGRRVRLAVGMSVLVVLAACGAGTSAPGPSPAAPVSSPPGASSDPTATLQRALLTPGDVGNGFVPGSYQPPDPSRPSPCGKPSVAAQFPQALRLGTELDKGQSLQLIESLTVLPDVATAQAAYAAGVAGLSCRQARLDAGAPPVTIGAPRDVTAQVGGDKAMAWSLSAQGLKGSLVAVQSAEAVITFSFLALGSADTSTAPDPVAVAKTGVAKILAA